MKERISEQLALCVKTLLADAGCDSEVFSLPPVTVPKDSSHGDFATNAAMVLAGKLKKPPREIAETIVQKMNAALDGVATCEIAGPGFINFRLSDDAGDRVFNDMLAAGDAIGFSKKHEGETVNVEYVSANPTGPLTVGHGRNAALGDVVAHLFSAVGYDVTREYYFNDAGNQMTVLAQSVHTRYLQLCGENVELDEGAYQGEYIIDIARKVKEEKGDTLCSEEDLSVFLSYAVEATFGMIKATLSRMRVHHDVYFNEKTLYENGEIEKTVTALRDRGLAYDKDDATWFAAQKFGAEKDRVLIKSSGEPTYRLPDIAYHCDKCERGYDRIIDIFGADHIATIPDVLAALRALGKDADKVTVLIHQFVTVVRGGEVVKMSTRKANYITLDDLMDDAGVDATRYFFVMRKRESHCEFDIELARSQTLENPVFYVQYAYARICSVFRHATEELDEDVYANITADTVDASCLKEDAEQELIRILAQCSDAIEKAAETCEPHRLTNYVESVAEAFHRFYTQHKVIIEDKSTARARLALALLTQRVLRNCLGILGVEAPESM